VCKKENERKRSVCVDFLKKYKPSIPTIQEIFVKVCESLKMTHIPILHNKINVNMGM
jgi:hypothetical protein